LLGSQANKFVSKHQKDLNTYYSIKKLVEAQREGDIKPATRLYVISA